MRVELLAGREGPRVDARHHRVVGVAPPVGPGDRAELEARLGQLPRVLHVRPVAHVEEGAVRVEADRVDFKGPPDDAPAGCLPWFQVPGRKSAGVTVVFGHWAAMGLRLEADAIGLDSGCVWGQKLTAIRLEDRAIFQHPAVEGLPPALRRR